MVNLTPADVQDARGAAWIIAAVRRRRRRPWLGHPFAAGAYGRGRLMSRAADHDVVVEVVRRLAGRRGFQPPSRRWVVERTFGRMRRRRLVRDDEQRRQVSEAMISVAIGGLLLRRISHP